MTLMYELKDFVTLTQKKNFLGQGFSKVRQTKNRRIPANYVTPLRGCWRRTLMDTVVGLQPDDNDDDDDVFT